VLAAFFAVNKVSAATEFVSIIDPDNGAGTDYTSLNAWEAAIETDLATTTTLVFSITGHIGTTADAVVVTGQTSGATGTVLHLASSTGQVLIEDIAGIFQNGEVISDGFGTSTLTSTGTQAIAVAQCRSTGGTADTTIITLSGWTTSSSTYIKIWTDPTDNYGRHRGKWDDNKYRLEYSGNLMLISESYVWIDGLQIKYVNPNTSDDLVTFEPNQIGWVKFSNSIITSEDMTSGDNYNTGLRVGSWQTDYHVWNNIISGFKNGDGTYCLERLDGTSYFYNNTFYDCRVGAWSGSNRTRDFFNNIAQNCENGFSGNFGSNSDYNISDIEGDAPNLTFSTSSINVKFADEANGDFHLDPTDTSAVNVGTSSIFTDSNLSFYADIDGTPRGGAVDIGADEVPVEYISTICENTSAGGTCANSDYSLLSSWENAVETDLTATSTRVFSGSVTGTLNENDTVILYENGTTTNITATVVATTSDQILLDNITVPDNASSTLYFTIDSVKLLLSTASGTEWVKTESTDYWTVTGTNDQLGASPIAIAKIDGAWASAESTILVDDVVDIIGWTTDNDNYIKIYTTGDARHHGKWDDTAYRISVSNTGSDQASAINNREYYVKIDGLQVDYTHNSTSDYGFGLNLVDYWANIIDSEIEASNNIIKGGILNGTGVGISVQFHNPITKIYNNIVYGFTRDGGQDGACIVVDGDRSYAYNNTVHNCIRGIYRKGNTPIIKNNLVSSSTDPFYSTFHADSTNNATDGTDTPSGGSNTVTNATINFVSVASGTEDFHLAEINPDIMNAGADLSSDSYINSSLDVDGAAHNPDGSGWDIGADEVATKQYRSVGNTSTALSISGTVTISSTTKTATFSTAQPNNVGVGDVVQYGTPYRIAFITSRASSTEYGVQAYDTSAPLATTTAAFAIYRAYLELDDWNDQGIGNVNSSIDSSVDDLVLVGNDILASNTQMMVACYASTNGDNDQVSGIDTWTTGLYNYIKIFTPVDTNEVGDSQRHNGKWEDGRYNITTCVNYGSVLNINANIVIDGLQLKNNCTQDQPVGLGIYGDELVTIKNNIIAFDEDFTVNSQRGITMLNPGESNNIHIYNNIIYNAYYGIILDPWSTYSVASYYINNNTIVNSKETGIYVAIDKSSTDEELILKNNLVQNSSNVDYYIYGTGNLGTYETGNNIASDNSSPNDSFDNKNVGFVDSINNDYHLSPADTAAIDMGTSSIVSDPGIWAGNINNYDVDGHYRRTWDIGADEASIEFVSTVEQSNGDFSKLSLWEDGIETDLVATTTAVFSSTGKTGTFQAGNTFTGQTSNATGTLVHMGSSSDQVLLESIQGDLISGEQISDGNGTTTLSDAGNPAIAVAKIDGAWTIADDTAVTINGWNTGEYNYVMIYTTDTARHNGKWNDNKYRLEVTIGGGTANLLNVIEEYTKIEGLQIKFINTGSSGDKNAFSSSIDNISISSSIFTFDNSGGGGTETLHGINVSGDNIFIYNNIIYNFSSSDGSSDGIRLDGPSGPDFYVFNNTINGIDRGMYTDWGNHYLRNNISSNNSVDYYDSGNGTRYTGNNVSSDGTTPNAVFSSTTVKFLDSTSNDFHLDPTDTAAINSGTSTIFTDSNLSFYKDIDGTPRGGAVDIGADEVPVEYVSTICENTGAGGDCANLDYSALSTWEDKVETDLTATSTRVFSGTQTGTLSENDTVTLYENGTTTNITATVVATTSDQILLDNITVPANASSTQYVTIDSIKLLLSVSSSSLWVETESANYWTVTGTNDELGASPIAIAKIDGVWGTSDTVAVDIDGWESDNDNYIKVYTTNIARHNGKWNNNKYRLVNDYAQYTIKASESNIKIDGVQISIASSTIPQRCIDQEEYSGMFGEYEISNNILKGSNGTEYNFGIYSNADGGSITKVWNNIIYDIGNDSGAAGIRLYYSNAPVSSLYVYNNTMHNVTKGLFRSGNSFVAINNLISSTTDPFDGTFHADSTNNATDGTDTPSGGSNTVTNATINFVSTASGTEDFHLAENNSDLLNAGVDLSNDSYIDSLVDIDGAAHNPDDLGWDIGADEVTTKQYRSVGNTSASLSTGGTVTISSTTRTATFSTVQADNVGVGDVIQYGSPYQLAFIINRASSTEYGVQAYNTKAPTATTSASFEIYRAHLELDDWEDQVVGDVNSGIDDTVDDLVLVNTDLVASNTKMMVAAYASTAGDDAATVIDGWETNAQNKIKVFTPVSSNEVGTSQRHEGKWDDDKYNISISQAGYAISLPSNGIMFVDFDGLQLWNNYAGNDYIGAIYLDGVNDCEINISNNILRGPDQNSNSTGMNGIGSVSTIERTAKAWNNISYNWLGVGVGRCFSLVDDYIYIYNNTAYNCYIGINTQGSNDFHARNNIVYNTTRPFNSNNPLDDSYYNLTDSSFMYYHWSSEQGSNTNDKVSQVVKFVNEANNDYHLAPDDTSAIDAGTSSVDISFSDDIDGHYRRTWDIGADEASVEFVATVEESNGDFSKLSLWETGVETNLVATTTAVFSSTGKTGTFQPGNAFIGQTSGATGALVHIGSSSDQVLLENIQGDFVLGEQIGDGNGTTTLSDAGNPAIAVAKIDGAWTIADDTAAIIDDWNTGPNNYVRIYTTDTARHNGKWDNGKYRITRDVSGWNGYTLRTLEDYTQIDGLQVESINSTTYYGAGIGLGEGQGQPARESKVSNSIVRGVNNENNESFGIHAYSYWTTGGEDTYYIYNNIVYDFEGGEGIRVYSNKDTYVYNNVIVNSNRGIRDQYGDDAVVINNIVQNCTTDYSGDFTTLSDYNISSDNTAPGANSKTNTTVNFVDLSNNDFHLTTTDTTAKDAGVDLSTDSALPFSTDMEGHSRHDTGWDIGADESPTIIFRSTGRHETDLNTESETVTILVATNTASAVFSGGLADNIGVGDVIEHGLPLTLAFVTGRVSSSTYYVQSATGSPPIATSSQAASVFRAHRLLNDWENQIVSKVNQSIDASLQSEVLVSQDLVASNTAMFVPCYATTSPDDSWTVVNGWTTGTTTYIKIYTPKDISEVGVGQRHNGVWDDEKFVIDAGFPLQIYENVKVEGLQLRSALAPIGIQQGAQDVEIYQNILNGDSAAMFGIVVVGATSTADIRINNNVIYNIDGSGIERQSGGTGAPVSVFNNTISSTTIGITDLQGDTIVARNNVVFDSDYDFWGNFITIDYNASDEATGTNAIDISPGSVEADGWHAAFKDYVNNDFRIRDNSSVLYNRGTTISTIVKDIIDTARPLFGIYDIGAFELAELLGEFRIKGNVKLKGNVKFK